MWKKGHVAKSCHAIVNQICGEQPNKGQNIEGKHVDSTQIVPLLVTKKHMHGFVCYL